MIPTWNEVGTAATLVGELLALPFAPTVWVMDDGSTDGTLESLAELTRGRDRPRSRGAAPRRTRGRSRAGRRAGRPRDGRGRAIADGAEWVVQMDGDLSHEPRFVPDLVAAGATADLVIGSRYVKGVSVVHWPFARLMLSIAANRYVRTVTGLRATDCTSGFRLWRASLLEDLELDTLTSEGYSFLVESLFRAVRAGARVVEVPIVFVERRAGESKLSSRVFLESALLPWRLLGRRLFPRRRHPQRP